MARFSRKCVRHLFALFGTTRFAVSCAGAQWIEPPAEDRMRSKLLTGCPRMDCRTWRAFDKGSPYLNAHRAIVLLYRRGPRQHHEEPEGTREHRRPPGRR